MMDNQQFTDAVGPWAFRFTPTEDNPCLMRLAKALKTKDDQPLQVDQLRFEAPVAQNCERSFFCLSNTKVVVRGADNVGEVELTYNRKALDTLAHDYGPVVIGFTPKTLAHLELMIKAMSIHFGRAISIHDVEQSSFDSLVEHPNGKWTIHLKASPDSFGWYGEYVVVFVISADLSKAAVTALDGFAYVRPPRPTDPDLTTSDTTMDGFVYQMPIDLARADVTSLNGFEY